MNRLNVLKGAADMDNNNLNLSTISSTSSASCMNIGYQTATEDSISSLYFSMTDNDQTLGAPSKTIENTDDSIEIVSPQTIKMSNKMKERILGMSSTPNKQIEVRFEDVSEIGDISVKPVEEEIITIEDESDRTPMNELSNTSVKSVKNGPKILAEFFANLDVNKSVPKIVISLADSEDKENDNIEDLKKNILESKSPVRKTARDRVIPKSRLSTLQALSEDRVASPINRNKRKSMNVRNIPNVLLAARKSNQISTSGVTTRRKSGVNLGVIADIVKEVSKISPVKTAPANSQQSLKTRKSLIPPPMNARKVSVSIRIPPKTTLVDPKKRNSLGKRKSVNPSEAAPKHKTPKKTLGAIKKPAMQKPSPRKNTRISIMPKQSPRKTSRTSIMPKASPRKVSRNTLMPKLSSIPKPSPRKALRKTILPSESKIKKPQELSCNICRKTFRLESMYTSHMKTHEKGDQKCKYCDKKFAISNALTNHLSTMCLKIPETERKKLLKLTHAELSKSQQNQKSYRSDSSGTTSFDDKSSSMAPPKTKLPYLGINRTPSKKLHCKSCKKDFTDVLQYTHHVLTHSKEASGSD